MPMVGKAGRVLAAAALATALPIMALADGDGWTGPTPFTGAALDDALADLNALLRERQERAIAMADLRTQPAGKDFRTIAWAVGDAPGTGTVAEDHGFGPAIADGESLQLHLAAFSESLRDRGQDLFVRVALAAAHGGLGFTEVADLPRPGVPTGFGPAVRDGATLDAHLIAFDAHIREQEWRAVTLAAPPAGHTGQSFDRYVSLLLY